MKNIIKSIVLVIIAVVSMTSCAPSKYYSDGKVTKVSGRAANTYVKQPKNKVKVVHRHNYVSPAPYRRDYIFGTGYY